MTDRETFADFVSARSPRLFTRFTPTTAALRFRVACTPGLLHRVGIAVSVNRS